MMGDILGKRAGDAVDAVWWRGRRRTTFSQALGAGLRANVIDGVLVGFGLEPIAGPELPGPARHHLTLMWAAPLAGAAAAGAVATGLVWRHRRAA
jgi:hypothetical protein